MVEILNKRVAKAFVAPALVGLCNFLPFLVRHVAPSANPRQFHKWQPELKIEHEYRISDIEKVKSQTVDIGNLQFTIPSFELQYKE